MMSTFDAFPPNPVLLTVGEDTLEITPIRVGEVPALLAAVRPFADQVSADPDWLALLTDHGEALISALAVASRRERGFIEQLSLDDAIQLATVVFEVNADFFVHRVVPAVQQAAARVNGKLSGATSSTGCCAPGTATPTS
jgi:hypothetical protein